MDTYSGSEEKCSNNTEIELQIKFIEQLSNKERHAYEIAKSHLGMSFQIEKSVAYLKWKGANT